MNKEKFLSIYGAAAYLKLFYLKELLEEKGIDVRKLNNYQITKMLGIMDYQTG
ncbi:hypothetical protein ACNSOL_12260 (plasmid) [Aliarcobacter lanthieri]|uniref:hypothetical protein n=1 Tax=Aliarcobacter lanthieri TaxID=1355374 RepID=UPI003AABA4EC